MYVATTHKHSHYPTTGRNLLVPQSITCIARISNTSRHYNNIVHDWGLGMRLYAGRGAHAILESACLAKSGTLQETKEKVNSVVERRG